jgi:hypothetical protein
VPNEHGGATTDDSGTTFRTLLLNKCQEGFEFYDHDGTAQTDAQHARIRKTRIGNVKFIAELRNKLLLNDIIILTCLDELLGDGTDHVSADDFEVAIALLTSVGEVLDRQATEEALSSYFKHIEELSQDRSIEARLRFLAMDLIELRSRRWEPRMKVDVPHATAAAQANAQQQVQYQHQYQQQHQQHQHQHQHQPPHYIQQQQQSEAISHRTSFDRSEPTRDDSMRSSSSSASSSSASSSASGSSTTAIYHPPSATSASRTPMSTSTLPTKAPATAPAPAPVQASVSHKTLSTSSKGIRSGLTPSRVPSIVPRITPSSPAAARESASAVSYSMSPTQSQEECSLQNKLKCILEELQSLRDTVEAVECWHELCVP